MLVDLSGEASVVVSEHAKAYFGMTSVHKDVATGACAAAHYVVVLTPPAAAATVALVESGATNQAVIKVSFESDAARRLYPHSMPPSPCRPVVTVPPRVHARPQAVHTKTRDVLQKLRVIAGDGSVTQEVGFVHELSAATFLTWHAGFGRHHPQRGAAALFVFFGAGRGFDMTPLASPPTARLCSSAIVNCSSLLT